MNDDEQDILWSWGSLLSEATKDGSPTSGLGRLSPLFRAPVSSGPGVTLLCCCSVLHCPSSCLKGRPRQKRGVSEIGNMKDKFALGAIDQEMIV
jgi:hypothetical protein